MIFLFDTYELILHLYITEKWILFIFWYSWYFGWFFREFPTIFCYLDPFREADPDPPKLNRSERIRIHNTDICKRFIFLAPVISKLSSEVSTSSPERVSNLELKLLSTQGSPKNKVKKNGLAIKRGGGCRSLIFFLKTIIFEGGGGGRALMVGL